MAQYGEPFPLEGYAPAPPGQFAQPMGHYGEMPEMPGYAEYQPLQEYPGVAYYGDPYLPVAHTPPDLQPQLPDADPTSPGTGG
jgi:hypothetical protein